MDNFIKDYYYSYYIHQILKWINDCCEEVEVMNVVSSIIAFQDLISSRVRLAFTFNQPV